MTASGDYHDEMRKRRPLSDRDIEDFFAGRTLPGEELLNSFAQSARVSSNGPLPLPAGELAGVLADGLTIDKGDLPVTAASKDTGPRQEPSGLPKWRRLIVATSTFLTALLTKVGMASAAAKAGLAAAVAAGALTAAGAAGALPPPVQNALSHAISDVTPINLPTTGSPAHGKPASPGVNGLDQANTTPAAGHAPTSLPAHQAGQSTINAGASDMVTPAPASAETQSANGLNQAGSTPAAGPGPTTAPNPRPITAGETSTGISNAGTHTRATHTKP